MIRKLVLLAFIALSTSGCVALDRALNPITNHTKHYSFTHPDVINGGIMVVGATEYGEDADPQLSVNVTASIARGLSFKRKKFEVKDARPLRGLIEDEVYHQALEQHRRERWIEPELMSRIRDSIKERYIVFAQVTRVGEYNDSSCHKYEKKKKKDKDGNETDEYEDGPDEYGVSRYATRISEISMDVFDLAQDIIVWSGTREGSLMKSEYYKTDHYVGDYSYTYEYPYPDYPTWSSTFAQVSSELAIHFPHKSD